MDLKDSLNQLKKNIDQAERSAQRPKGCVKILAVSKGQPCEKIIEAYRLGLSEFGENYWQEAKTKIQFLRDYPLIWHFIGPIQSNKAKEIAQHFAWVHSVDRIKIAELLSRNRPDNLPPIQVCIQVNLTREAGKSGVNQEELDKLVQKIGALPGLELRGLMLIPPQLENPDSLFSLFKEMQQLLVSLNQKFNLAMDTLSMGMSEDIIPAILAGSTLVRVGRALFGERLRKHE